MLISSMLPMSVLGGHVAPFERLVWFVYGQLEREHLLNQRAFVAWCRRPDSYSRWAQAMQTSSWQLQASLWRTMLRHAPRLPSSRVGSGRPERR